MTVASCHVDLYQSRLEESMCMDRTRAVQCIDFVKDGKEPVVLANRKSLGVATSANFHLSERTQPIRRWLRHCWGASMLR
jgi:hypothetical protein